MNPFYSNEPKEWDDLALSVQIDLIRTHLCTGPCGQSSQVSQQRQRIEKALRTASAVLAAWEDEGV